MVAALYNLILLIRLLLHYLNSRIKNRPIRGGDVLKISHISMRLDIISTFNPIPFIYRTSYIEYTSFVVQLNVDNLQLHSIKS